MMIRTKCQRCTKYAEGNGEALTFDGFVGYLKGQGWWISGNTVLCQNCRVYAETNLLKEIFGEKT